MKPLMAINKELNTIRTIILNMNYSAKDLNTLIRIRSILVAVSNDLMTIDDKNLLGNDNETD